MKLSVHQLVAILITVVLVVVFYFGCDIQSKDIKSAEKSRASQMSTTSIQNIKRTAFDSLTPSQAAYYDGLQLQLSEAVYEEDKVTILKELSGFWYQQGAYALAGDVATQIAELEETAEAWRLPRAGRPRSRRSSGRRRLFRSRDLSSRSSAIPTV